MNKELRFQVLNALFGHKDCLEIDITRNKTYTAYEKRERIINNINATKAIVDMFLEEMYDE